MGQKLGFFRALAGETGTGGHQKPWLSSNERGGKGLKNRGNTNGSLHANTAHFRQEPPQGRKVHPQKLRLRAKEHLKKGLGNSGRPAEQILPGNGGS